MSFNTDYEYDRFRFAHIDPEAITDFEAAQRVADAAQPFNDLARAEREREAEAAEEYHGLIHQTVLLRPSAFDEDDSLIGDTTFGYSFELSDTKSLEHAYMCRAWHDHVADVFMSTGEITKVPEEGLELDITYDHIRKVHQERAEEYESRARDAAILVRQHEGEPEFVEAIQASQNHEYRTALIHFRKELDKHTKTDRKDPQEIIKTVAVTRDGLVNARRRLETRFSAQPTVGIPVKESNYDDLTASCELEVATQHLAKNHRGQIPVDGIVVPFTNRMYTKSLMLLIDELGKDFVEQEHIAVEIAQNEFFLSRTEAMLGNAALNLSSEERTFLETARARYQESIREPY